MDGTTYVFGEQPQTPLAVSIRWMILRMYALIDTYEKIVYVNNTSPNTLLNIVKTMGGDSVPMTTLLKAIDYQRIESVKDIVLLTGDVVVVENLQTVVASSLHQMEYNELNYLLTRMLKRTGQVYMLDVQANEFVRRLVDTEVVVEQAGPAE
ncbi:uncharacterized protein CANTADRAFT_334484 [Suhomyces tanzawaensis NRRL Y-17324]|uniref:Uncharacterized protein n=1 Tax=Suhomyces tanzawaensis NRRL Y-17324 TaxID=984487 RepID=A0A1E4SBD3_9ASCO|nr:uncharacterized protein CANTADRAFT_334484 [Suhomyces tanzawaensis NRRL Y-17324]ODV76837.1 hypothetical protein CANTADRAFT_334484 [Suhomyces tanzawaensis NRRL Y-17324]